MTNLSTDELRVNVSIPVDLLARLMASQQLCAADLKSLDSNSHDALRRLMLTLCAGQLKGDATQCDACDSQAYCQQLSQVNLFDSARNRFISSVSIH
jgi:hypothetical protein